MSKAKRMLLWVVVGFMVVGVSCLLLSRAIVRYIGEIPSEEEAAIAEMDAILQAARANPNGPPPEDIRRWALIMPGDKLWVNLQRWMTDAPGPYRLDFIAGDEPYSPGDDATVHAKLSNGVNITCYFYNSTLENCEETKE